MSLTIREEERPQRKLVEAGNHRATLVRLVEHGEQLQTWDNKEAYKSIVYGMFELNDLEDEFNGEIRPMAISFEKTKSLGEKSALRALLEGWRGQAFTSKEIKEFSLKTLLGKPALVNVVHQVSKTGRTYATIKSISRLPKGMKAAKQVNDSVFYEIEEGEGGAFQYLPQWQQDKIRQSREFQEKRSGSATQSVEVSEADPDKVPF